MEEINIPQDFQSNENGVKVAMQEEFDFYAEWKVGNASEKLRLIEKVKKLYL